ncbi:MAG: phytoene/squalene synthase family protein [Acidimicrobiia bacterium]|nr:phytoene/squalene synthase family protein [Acidimicrobiia bacterium]
MDPVAQSSREAIRKGSKSFAAAARLFDPETRGNVYKLYAWCRYCDDVIDGQELGFARAEPQTSTLEERLTHIRDLTERALAGEHVDEPEFQALQHIVQRYEIPHRHPMDLIEGFAMDAADYQYETVEDTLLYCYHVAGVVGVMMTYVMGVSDAAVLRRAADLGIAFQLTNIARDVMDDASAGRCYLPRDLLRKNGVPPDQVANPEYRANVVKVAKELLRVADRYYESAAEGVRALPLRAAWAICTARGVYRDIGEIVLAQGESAWQRRAVVSRSRKMFWVLAGGMRAIASVGLRRFQNAAPRASDLWMKPGIN